MNRKKKKKERKSCIKFLVEDDEIIRQQVKTIIGTMGLSEVVAVEDFMDVLDLCRK